MSQKVITDKDRFTVIQDTREKLFWSFPKDTYCNGSIIQKLDSGDYSIMEAEPKSIVIERKKSSSELANNIYEKRFEAELIRLEEFKYPYMVCEFTWQDILCYPINSGVPEKLWHHLKVRAEHLEKAVTRYQLIYKTKIIFARKFGQKATYNLFKYFMRMKNGKL